MAKVIFHTVVLHVVLLFILSSILLDANAKAGKTVVYEPSPRPSAMIVVRGYVICRPCSARDYDNHMNPFPILGAAVTMQCPELTMPDRSTRTFRESTSTWGEFSITLASSESLLVDRCKIFVSSPVQSCDMLVNAGDGTTEFSPGYERTANSGVSAQKQMLYFYTTGPVFFAPQSDSFARQVASEAQSGVTRRVTEKSDVFDHQWIAYGESKKSGVGAPVSPYG